ncbi:MAG: putative deacylase [Arenicella sp.]|jgi:predicted deacylase
MVLILVSVVQAQENVLPQETPTMPSVVDRDADIPPIKTKREIKKLPAAKNVDLKDIVEELEEVAPLPIELAPLNAKRDIKKPPTDKSIDLNDIIREPEEVVPAKNALPQSTVAPEPSLLAVKEAEVIEEKISDEQLPVTEEREAIEEQAAFEEPGFNPIIAPKALVAEEKSKFILGMEVSANTATRLTWTPESKAGGLAERTPVLVVNGKSPGKTLCLTAAMHGDELNGIEMIRRIMYELEPERLTGTVIGVPVVNLMGFRRNSRYLPDRRDLNRYFPGNTSGSSASRIAHSFFTQIILHCDVLIDIHTGSLNRTNLTQLRADLSNPEVVSMAKSFGLVPVLNSPGNPRSLRAAAARAGIPTVTIEAGEPMRMQRKVVDKGTKAIKKFMATMGMVGRTPRKPTRSATVYYKSSWVRANQSGIFFSNAQLGKRVVEGEILGTVTDPITNRRSEIISPFRGRILGMALDQLVLPGFAIYHIGIQPAEALLIEEGLLAEENATEESRKLNVVSATSLSEVGASQDDILDND